MGVNALSFGAAPEPSPDSSALMPAGLDAALDRAARTRLLLVACDFDGVLAPLASTPGDARAEVAAVDALRAVAQLQRTWCAVVSGRPLAQLRVLVGSAPGLILVGSHGAEWEHESAWLDDERRRLVEHAATLAENHAALCAGALVERKPLGAAFHYRLAVAEAGEAAAMRVEAEWNALAGGRVRRGHMVVEVQFADADKGLALDRLRQRLGATAVVFMGDDITDEDAQASLREDDVGVRIGAGPTRARWSVPGQDAVTPIVQRVLQTRTHALGAARPVPIERHAVLSDQRTAAILDDAGRIVWMCVPRIDSGAIFSALLGGPDRGSFDVAPAGEHAAPTTSYLGDSMILRTTWPGPGGDASGGVTLTDYFDCTGGRAFQRAGRSDLVRCVEGTGVVRIRFAPRPDFGRTPAEVAAHDGGLTLEGSAESVVLASPGVEWKLLREGAHHTAIAEWDLARGPLVMELRCGFGSLRPAPVPELSRRQQTERFWSGWAATLRLPALQPALVKRSALAIKSLVYGPSGSMCAAATTSLPETLGGVRNWDYRYCWPRDACLAASSLVKLGNTGVAMKLLDWLVGVVASIDAPERLRPLYTVSGQDLGPEGEIGELAGYAESRPVRIGNAADRQVQLDVFGPIVALVADLVHAGAPVTPEHWRLVESMVAAVAARWQEPDHGIWEIRGPRRHHTHTKAMCWLAVDRGVFMLDQLFGRRRPEWEALRDAIRADALQHSWHDGAGACTAAYGCPDLDAAALAIGLTGMTPPDDPRFVATVHAVNQRLREGPTVLRYRFDDGLPGIEGGFHICTSWLIESLWMIGERAAARALFDEIAALVGPLGLMAEQHDPRGPIGAAALGNFPQAYSHLGLINAAVRLSDANTGG